jgi:hypothetical protein
VAVAFWFPKAVPLYMLKWENGSYLSGACSRPLVREQSFCILVQIPEGEKNCSNLDFSIHRDGNIFVSVRKH